MWHVNSGRAIGRRKEVIYMPPIAYFDASNHGTVGRQSVCCDVILIGNSNLGNQAPVPIQILAMCANCALEIQKKTLDPVAGVGPAFANEPWICVLWRNNGPGNRPQSEAAEAQRSWLRRGGPPQYCRYALCPARCRPR